MRALALLALLAAGCLSAPTRPAALDGAVGAVDGGPPSADAGPVSPFPARLGIRYQFAVADLDFDGKDDLVLLNSPVGGDGSALVLLGRAQGFFTGVDHVVPLAGLDPVALAVADFMGDASLDLLVLARDASDGWILAFPNIVDGFFGEVVSQKLPFRPGGGSVDDAEPVFATTVRVRGVAKRDAVVGDLSHLYLVAPDDWSLEGIAQGRLSDIPHPTDNWLTVNDAIPAVSATADREDLVVVDNANLYWLKNDGFSTGGFTDPVTFSDVFSPTNVARTTRLFDLGGDGLPELATTYNDQSTQVMMTSLAAGEPALDVYTVSPAFDFGDDQGDAIWLGDLDEDGEDELLILDDTKPPAGGSESSGLQLAGSLVVRNPTTIGAGTNGNDLHVFSAPSPTRLAVGDFDGDGRTEMWVFDSSLSEANLRCFRAQRNALQAFKFSDCGP